MSHILFGLTGHDRMANGGPAGVRPAEHAVSYHRRRAAGHPVTRASVAGGGAAATADEPVAAPD